jgi:hypothetical protein
MPGLNIPRQYRPAFAIIRELPEPALNDMLLQLERSPDSAPTVENLPPEDAKQVADALKAMYQIREFHEVELDEFVSDICDALRQYKEWKDSDDLKFRDRLTSLLDIEPLNIAAKAVTLLSEHEHAFCSARVLTDARPVYGKSVLDPPAAMIITHTLKLAYHEGPGGRLNDIYIALGSNDLAELHEVLSRAANKAKSLRTAIQASGLRFVDPQE